MSISCAGGPGILGGALSAWLAGVEVVLSVGLFVACSAYVRLRLKVLPAKQTASTSPGP